MDIPQAAHHYRAAQTEPQTEEAWGSITTVNTLRADALHQMLLRTMPELDDADPLGRLGDPRS